MPDPLAIAPLDPDVVPSPVRGTVLAGRADVELAAWLSSVSAVPGLIEGNQNALVHEVDRALGMDANLALASTARATIVPGLGLDSVAPILSGPPPWMVTGQGLPTHPGNGGNVAPGSTLGAGVEGYVTNLIQSVLNTLFGAPLV